MTSFTVREKIYKISLAIDLKLVPFITEMHGWPISLAAVYLKTRPTMAADAVVDNVRIAVFANAPFGVSGL